MQPFSPLNQKYEAQVQYFSPQRYHIGSSYQQIIL